MKRAAARAAYCAVLATATGCFSVARTREREVIATEGRTATLAVLIDAPGPVLSDPPLLVYDVIVPLVLWPFETVLDVCLAVRAPFDPNFDVQWGPVGAIGAIVLPWVTVVPYFYPPVLGRPTNVAPATFDALLERVRAGDGVAGYRELLGADGQLARYTIHDVQLAPEAAPQKPVVRGR